MVRARIARAMWHRCSCPVLTTAKSILPRESPEQPATTAETLTFQRSETRVEAQFLTGRLEPDARQVLRGDASAMKRCDPRGDGEAEASKPA